MAGKTTFKALRTERGYTSARRLGRDCHVGPMAVLGWDSGSTPNGPHLIRLSEVLNASPAFILRVIESSKPKKIAA